MKIGTRPPSTFFASSVGSALKRYEAMRATMDAPFDEAVRRPAHLRPAPTGGWLELVTQRARDGTRRRAGRARGRFGRLLLCVGSEPHVLLVEHIDSAEGRSDVTVAGTEAGVALVEAPTGLTGFLLALRVSD